MAAQEPIALRPIFQPRPDRDDVAAMYALQVLSWKVVKRESGCWEWTGRRSEDGYGVVEVGDKTVRVTRLVYSLCVADVPDELLACHTCDNPPCCRPGHLFLGTHQDNARDMVAKGRRRGNYGKLKPDQVKQIRLRAGSCAKDVVGPLAAEFGVSVNTIIDIVARRSWKEIV